MYVVSTFSLYFHEEIREIVTLILLFTTTPTFVNSVDPDQMASEEPTKMYVVSTFNLYFHEEIREILTLILLFMTTPTFANSVDPDQMASEEAIWSGSTLFVIQFVNLNKNIWCNLIGL